MVVTGVTKCLFYTFCGCCRKHEEVHNIDNTGNPEHDKSKKPDKKPGVLEKIMKKKKGGPALPQGLKETRPAMCGKSCMLCCLICVGVVLVMPAVVCFKADSFSDQVGACAFVEFAGFFSRFGHFFSPT